jgi:hypothetical protein
MITEQVWERARLNQAHRERMRLFRKGLLSFISKPIVMVKTAEGWKLPPLSVRE